MPLLDWILGMITLAAPLLLAAMGGLASERSGVINIALEGKMLFAAVLAASIAANSGSAALGLLAAILGAVSLSLLHWLLCQRFRIDHIVSGMAINAAAFGASDYVYKRFIPTSLPEVARFPTAFYWALAIIVPFAVAAYLQFTRGGLRLLAVGNDPGKARQMGVRPESVRLTSLAFCGIMCGLAGALLVANASSYGENMTAGKGFIALAALIVGQWKPLPTLIACLFVGLLQQMQIVLQGVPVFGIEVPVWVWISLPYLVTVAAMAGFLGKTRPPAGLGKP